MKEPKEFSYWKHPYQKWLLFLAGVIQLLCLFLNVREFPEYRHLLEIGFLNASQWESYFVGQCMQCALNILLLVLFFGCLLIGRFARSAPSARRAEGILLLCKAALWGVAGLLLRFPAFGTTCFIWGLILIALLCCGAFSLWKSHKKPANLD